MRTFLSAIVLMLLLVPGRTMAGLEITAYKGLEKVENPIFDIDGEPVNFASVLRLISSDFPERLDSFESGAVYHFHGMREVEVGSSSWYNYWRNELAKVAGYGPTYIVYEGKKEKRYDETVWRRHSGPFYELIDFSDAEGVIGPKTCAKLYNKTLGNKVTANKIDQIQDSGIYFADIVAGNQVTANQITCWPGVECRTVYAEPINFEQNKISGNKLVKPK